jgi:sugar lactone lactonase YvrE
VVFDPSGKQLKEIIFSGKNMTCPTWGGKNFNILFITSASGSLKGDEGGQMFRYKTRVKGLPKFEFAG